MAQLHFMVDQEFFVGLFSLGKDEAWAKLMECMLNQFLKAESDEVVGAAAYERKETRTDYRNGERERSLTTRIGKLTLKVPRHRNEAFHTSLLDNYQRCEQAFITSMMEMVIQGVSTRKVEKVTQELCGSRFSKSTISDLLKNLDKDVAAFRNRPLKDAYPFLMCDAMYIKVREENRVRSKAFLVALGINLDGRKEIVGFELCESETEYHWEHFLQRLYKRGLRSPDLIISDQHKGLITAIRKVYTSVAWQRCQVHFRKNILDQTSKRRQEGLRQELNKMFYAGSLKEAREIKKQILQEYSEVEEKAMDVLDNGFEDAMAVMELEFNYRRILRSTNVLERENRELRRRENVIGIFPNKESAIRLLGSVLLDHHEGWMSVSRVLTMSNYLAERQHWKEVLLQKKVA